MFDCVYVEVKHSRSADIGNNKTLKYIAIDIVIFLKIYIATAVVKIDCSKQLAFLLHVFKLISNQQQLISKTDTYVQSM